mmetsp:Transcript_13526/g.30755  ORF Transcript_13526/g.30755 Transcript_13526/m.30755 type:complete len:470 (-) Transcript_13526:98-1507(-)
MKLVTILSALSVLPGSHSSSNAGVPVAAAIHKQTTLETCPTTASEYNPVVLPAAGASGAALLQRTVARQAGTAISEHEETGAPAPTPSPTQSAASVLQVHAELSTDLEANGEIASRGSHPGSGKTPDASFVHQLAERAASVKLAAGEKAKVSLQAFVEAMTERREAANMFIVISGIVFLTVVLSLAMYWFAQVSAHYVNQEQREESRHSLGAPTQPPPHKVLGTSSLPSSSRQAPGRAAQEVLSQFEKKERGLPAAAPGNVATLPLDPATSMPAEDILSMIFIVPEPEGQSLQLRGEFGPWEQDGAGTVHRHDPQQTPIASLKMCEKGGSGKGILISPMHRLSQNPPVGFIDTANAVNNQGLPAPSPRFVTLQAVSEGWKHRPVAVVHKDDKVEGRFLIRKYSPQKFDAGAVLLIIIKGQDLRVQDAYFRLIATVDSSRLDRVSRTLNIAHGIDASLVFSSVIAVAKLS